MVLIVKLFDSLCAHYNDVRTSLELLQIVTKSYNLLVYVCRLGKKLLVWSDP